MHPPEWPDQRLRVPSPARMDFGLSQDQELLQDAVGPFLGHALAALALQLAGSEAQQARWLRRLASGEVVATVALGEAGERWLPAQWTARCEQGRLHGEK